MDSERVPIIDCDDGELSNNGLSRVYILDVSLGVLVRSDSVLRKGRLYGTEVCLLASLEVLLIWVFSSSSFSSSFFSSLSSPLFARHVFSYWKPWLRQLMQGLYLYNNHLISWVFLCHVLYTCFFLRMLILVMKIWIGFYVSRLCYVMKCYRLSRKRKRRSLSPLLASTDLVVYIPTRPCGFA